MQQQGSSLIEFLISLAICTFVLVALLTSQIHALRHSKAQITYQHAEQLSTDLFERIRANPQGLAQYMAYPAGISAAINCSQNSCNANELAQYDLQQWQNQLEQRSSVLADHAQLCLDDLAAGLRLRWAWSAQLQAETVSCDQALLIKDLVLL